MSSNGGADFHPAVLGSVNLRITSTLLSTKGECIPKCKMVLWVESETVLLLTAVAAESRNSQKILLFRDEDLKNF